MRKIRWSNEFLLRLWCTPSCTPFHNQLHLVKPTRRINHINHAICPPTELLIPILLQQTQTRIYLCDAPNSCSDACMYSKWALIRTKYYCFACDLTQCEKPMFNIPSPLYCQPNSFDQSYFSEELKKVTKVFNMSLFHLVRVPFPYPCVRLKFVQTPGLWNEKMSPGRWWTTILLIQIIVRLKLWLLSKAIWTTRVELFCSTSTKTRNSHNKCPDPLLFSHSAIWKFRFFFCFPSHAQRNESSIFSCLSGIWEKEAFRKFIEACFAHL